MIDKRAWGHVAVFGCSLAMLLGSGGCDSELDAGELRAKDDEKGHPNKGTCEPDEPDEVCVGIGCPCEQDPAVCTGGLFCAQGVCTEAICNDGIIEGPEECEDGNLVDGDGCDSDCTLTRIVSVDSSGAHTCVLLDSGLVRCFGWNQWGAIGLGLSYLQSIGDNELPSSTGPVPLDKKAVQVVTGAYHTCALLEDGFVRCWGYNSNRRLGNTTTTNIGDSARDVNHFGNTLLNERAVALSNHRDVTCAILESGSLRCWGYGPWGTLGMGENIGGIAGFPANYDPLAIPGQVTMVASSHQAYHTCALNDSNEMYCWGRGWYGALGLGQYVWAQWVPTGPISAIAAGLPEQTKIVAVAAAEDATCVAYDTGDAHCWGINTYGQLGRGHTNDVGLSELPSDLPPIDLGGRQVVDVVGGQHHFCARLASGEALCWGRNQYGQLGRGAPGDLGDDETLADVAPLDFGGHAVIDISAASWGSCFLLDEGSLYCTGRNSSGELGYGATVTVGVNETPWEFGPISVY
jgi:cysteine-rich repeat protein